jgi:hypothetical protein
MKSVVTIFAVAKRYEKYSAANNALVERAILRLNLKNPK